MSNLLIILLELISIAGPDSSIAVEIFIFQLLNACQMGHVNGLLLYQEISFCTRSGCFQELVFNLDLFLGFLRFLLFLIPVIHCGLFDQLFDSDAWSCELFWLFVRLCLNKINFLRFLVFMLWFWCRFQRISWFYSPLIEILSFHKWLFWVFWLVYQSSRW